MNPDNLWQQRFRKLIADTDDTHTVHDFRKPFKGTYYIDGFEMEAFIAREREFAQQEILEHIAQMLIWSKGTPEGTRKDIVAKAARKFEIEIP